MTSSRPYLLRAIYEWLIDNQLTPYIMVDATLPYVVVPERFIDDGKIILNIEANAVSRLRMGNEAVEFDARFSGSSKHVYTPISAIKAIYARENGRGMVFNDEDDDGDSSSPSEGDTSPKGKPSLRIVK